MSSHTRLKTTAAPPTNSSAVGTLAISPAMVAIRTTTTVAIAPARYHQCGWRSSTTSSPSLSSSGGNDIDHDGTTAGVAASAQLAGDASRRSQRGAVGATGVIPKRGPAHRLID